MYLCVYAYVYAHRHTLTHIYTEDSVQALLLFDYSRYLTLVTQSALLHTAHIYTKVHAHTLVPRSRICSLSFLALSL